jgi:tripartite-type tricarboxylate transporter receptor subunit TctC
MNIGRRGFAFSAASLLAFPAAAQEAWPARPVTLVVPYPPGNAADISGRLLLEPLSTEIGQRLVIDNRAGASGIMGSASVARAAPNGYTLLLTSNSPIASGPWVTKNVPYVVERDFTPIAGIARGALVLLAASDVPVSTTAEFVTYVKANPGKTSYGSFGQGNLNHLIMEMLRLRLGLDMVHVPYRGSGPAQFDLAAGRIQFLFDGAPGALARIKAGQAKGLAVSTLKRSPTLPDMPTLAESGLPELRGMDAGGWVGLFGPSQTPAPIVERLNGAMRAVIPAAQAKLLEQGLETFTENSPADFAAFVRADSEKWRQVVQEAKIEPQD